MTFNNNQGFVNLNNGPPPNKIVDYSGSNNALQLTYKPVTATPVPQDPPWYV